MLQGHGTQLKQS